MAAKSKKSVDVYDWIIKVIKSCKTIDQCESTRRLIDNFRNSSEYIGIPFLKMYLTKKITELTNENR